MQRFGPDSTLWPRKLKDLSLEFLGTNIQTYGKPHSPYEDAVAALDLYKTVRKDWEKLIQRKVSKTHEIQAEERDFQRKMTNQQRKWALQQHAAFKHLQQQMMWQQQQQQQYATHYQASQQTD